MVALKNLLIVVLLGLALADFDYQNNFSGSDPLLSLVGNTVVSGGHIQLTQPTTNQAGGLWFVGSGGNGEIIQGGFTMEFTFRIDLDSSPTADGFAFVFQNDGPAVFGLPGEGIGYEGIDESVAIEFDSFDNFPPIDPSGPFRIEAHNIPFSPNSGRADLALISGLTGSFPNDNNDHVVDLLYDYTLDSISLALNSVPVFSSNTFDLAQMMSFTNSRAFMGFTASTGGLFAAHRILTWTYIDATGGTGVGGDPHIFDIHGRTFNLPGANHYRLFHDHSMRVNIATALVTNVFSVTNSVSAEIELNGLLVNIEAQFVDEEPQFIVNGEILPLGDRAWNGTIWHGDNIDKIKLYRVFHENEKYLTEYLHVAHHLCIAAAYSPGFGPYFNVVFLKREPEIPVDHSIRSLISIYSEVSDEDYHREFVPNLSMAILKRSENRHH